MLREDRRELCNWMSKSKDKRSVDMQIMRDWVEPKSRILDLGCGRGILLDYLKQTRQTEVFGVDLSSDKIQSCVKRGLSAYLGDMMDFMGAFPDGHFDRVICSRTLQELDNPSEVIEEALRVSKRLTIGFVNFGYWKNRISMLSMGRRLENEVYPFPWAQARRTNPLSVRQFEDYCVAEGYQIDRKVFLRGDWKSEVKRSPNWFCRYAMYDLASG